MNSLGIIAIKKLPFAHDGVVLEQKYGNLFADMRKYQESLSILNNLAKRINQYNPGSLDYADVLWNIGTVQLNINGRDTAKDYFGIAYYIYSVLKADDEVF